MPERTPSSPVLALLTVSSVWESRLSAALRDVPDVVVVYPSDANFVMIETRDGRSFCERARRAGILVRAFDDPLLANCVRITVVKPGENDQLLTAVSGPEASRA